MDITKSLDNGTCTVVLAGKFTFFDHAAFRDIIDEIGKDAIRKIVLDMSGVTFIDSAGLGQLLLAHDESVKHNTPLVIRGAAGQVKKMFGVAHFEAMFTLED